jgi:hypothetical protein
MKTLSLPRYRNLAALLGLLILLAPAAGPVRAGDVRQELSSLVPKAEGWKESEERQTYVPDSLFEYINGAAESYLSFDFDELLVVQLEREESGASLTLEIYDMGTPANAFGIFSAERYPENEAAQVGDLGYLEDETLNFIAGRFYVKLLGFDLGDEAPSLLADIGRQMGGAVQEKGRLPGLLRAFPAENLVPRSEKYIKRNFLGHEFLSDGYTASYKVEGQEMEGFFVEAPSARDAEAMLGRLLEFFAKDKQVPEKVALGYHVKNRYGQHFFVGRSGSVLFGVTRVPEGLEKAGETLFGRLAASLAAQGAPKA